MHLAQSAHYREFPEGAPDVFAVNVALDRSASLEYARRAGARSVVLASTGGVYGYRRHPIRELRRRAATDDVLLPLQAAAELLAEAYAELFSVVVFRFFFVYGAGQRADADPDPHRQGRERRGDRRGRRSRA